MLDELLDVNLKVLELCCDIAKIHLELELSHAVLIKYRTRLLYVEDRVAELTQLLSIKFGLQTCIVSFFKVVELGDLKSFVFDGQIFDLRG